MSLTERRYNLKSASVALGSARPEPWPMGNELGVAQDGGAASPKAEMPIEKDAEGSTFGAAEFGGNTCICDCLGPILCVM